MLRHLNLYHLNMVLLLHLSPLLFPLTFLIPYPLLYSCLLVLFIRLLYILLKYLLNTLIQIFTQVLIYPLFHSNSSYHLSHLHNNKSIQTRYFNNNHHNTLSHQPLFPFKPLLPLLFNHLLVSHFPNQTLTTNLVLYNIKFLRKHLNLPWFNNLRTHQIITILIGWLLSIRICLSSLVLHQFCFGFVVLIERYSLVTIQIIRHSF